MYLRTIIISLLVVSAVSCNEMKMGDKQIEINNENIAGSWKAELFETNMSNISAEEKEAGQAEFLSSTYVLKPDHAFELHSNTFAAGAYGKWSLDPELKELTMSYEMGSEHGVEIYTVTALTESQMTLRIDIPSMQAFIQLTLKRQ